MLQTDNGYTPKMDGPGHQDIIGDGRHSIMEDGFWIPYMDGCGYPGTNGHRRGLAGGRARTIMVGRHWGQMLARASLFQPIIRPQAIGVLFLINMSTARL